MRFFRWPLACIGFLIMHQGAHAASAVQIASDDWCPFVCIAKHSAEINGGFLVELTSKALALSGVEVQPQLMPLNRAMELTLSGRIDGIYAPAIDPRLRMTNPLFSSRACFYTRRSSTWRYSGIASISTLPLGAIADYGYDDGPMDAFLASQKPGSSQVEFNVGEQAGQTNLTKLLKGRYGVMLEHEAVMTYLLKMSGNTANVRQAGCLEKALPLVIGFSSKQASDADLPGRVDQGIAQLKASGEYTRLMRLYNIPVPDSTADRPAKHSN
ncbi:MAG: transporter substrate-binding domain-containing protein [Burkholderiales bacterium]|nr:transporter substrate-binding domain-containing protein [Burkholderiales bacterium]